jgi:DNA-binding MarR family transcriptional regulator
MVENGYLMQERSIHDKRSVRVKLSDKGKKLNDAITRLYKKHEEKLSASGLANARLESMNHVLRDLETFWGEQMGTGGLNVASGQ